MNAVVNGNIHMNHGRSGKLCRSSKLNELGFFSLNSNVVIQYIIPHLNSVELLYLAYTCRKAREYQIASGRALRCMVREIVQGIDNLCLHKR